MLSSRKARKFDLDPIRRSDQLIRACSGKMVNVARCITQVDLQFGTFLEKQQYPEFFK
jgi:hypothetical protein